MAAVTAGDGFRARFFPKPSERGLHGVGEDGGALGEMSLPDRLAGSRIARCLLGPSRSGGLDSNLGRRSGLRARLPMHASIALLAVFLGAVMLDPPSGRAGEDQGASSTISRRLEIACELHVDEIEVHWPSGEVKRVKDLAARQRVVIEEGKGVVAPPSRP